MQRKKEVHDIIKFVEKAGKLETTWRFSETFKDLRESVADHSWRLSLMTFLVEEEFGLKLDVKHAMKIAIVHDLAEAITGDIDAFHVITGKISNKQKIANEKKAINIITRGFPFGNKIKKLWQEYLDQKTKEAKFVKALDKIEAFLSILEAGYKEYNRDVFYANYADDAVKQFPPLKSLLAGIKTRLKRELSKGKIKWVE
ncbi:HD domain-containing protein [Candidatus Woesearchaeota archaeon]|nr:HD domain-containing protein [Candidatus Woesearchaeota archaeon]